MNGTPYIREIAGADTALLMIHGIVGTPAHFSMLYPYVPGNWSIYNMVLAGHGGSVEDFAAANMARWKQQTADWIAELSLRYEKIVIAAHSMGTLLAMEAVLQRPGRTSGLFLLNVPLKVLVRPRAVSNAFKVIFNRVSPTDDMARAMQQAYGIRADARLFKYLRWVPNYIALFRLIRQSRRRCGQIPVPCVCVQSDRDELVAPSSTKYLTGNPHIAVYRLERSGHFGYENKEREILCERFAEFCRSP